jgi:uncharacterized protein (TIGR00730 family)
MTTHIERLSTQIKEQIVQSHALTALPLGLSIFGSARTDPSHDDYKDAYALAALAAKHQVPVISGGGPGIMQAANQGAFENQGVAIGLNIALPNEQHSNRYQTHSLMYEHFAPRKIAFVSHSCAFAVYPGGFGTLDELFEVLTLVQTGKSGARPVVLVDKNYWNGLVEWLRYQVKMRGMIGPDDVSLLHVVDNAEEAWAVLQPYLFAEIAATKLRMA